MESLSVLMTTSAMGSNANAGRVPCPADTNWDERGSGRLGAEDEEERSLRARAAPAGLVRATHARRSVARRRIHRSASGESDRGHDYRDDTAPAGGGAHAQEDYHDVTESGPSPGRDDARSRPATDY